MKLKVAQAVVEVMKEQHSNVVFGIPGGQTLFVTDAMFEAGIKFVATRHEGAAGHAADGWGRLTGSPGICLATTGPGATNLITPLGGALRDSSPVIAMLFQNHLADVGRGDAQEANHEAIFGSIVKAVIPVRSADSVVWAVREAYRVALTGRPGPVVLDFYRDVVEKGETEYTYVNPQKYTFNAKSVPISDTVEQAVTILSQKERICIYCGNGVKNSKASAKVLELAELLNAAVVTSFNGIGSVPGTHPNVFGARTRHGSKITRSIIEDSDCVLVLGSSLSAVATNRWTIQFNHIIQVDFDSKNIGRQYPLECGITGDIAQTLDVIIPKLPKADEKRDAARKSWLQDINARYESWKKDVFSGPINDSNASPAAPVALMRELDALLKDDTILTVDAGNPGAWSQLLTIREKMSYMKPVNYGNMAFSLAAGMACSIAAPERDVITITGDGSLGMNLGELETIARVGANMTIIVNNDNAYGNIRQEENFKFGPRYYGVDLSKLNFAKIAKDLGCEAETITCAAELKDAMARSRSYKGPYLIDVKFNGNFSVWPEAY